MTSVLELIERKRLEIHNCEAFKFFYSIPSEKLLTIKEGATDDIGMAEKETSYALYMKDILDEYILEKNATYVYKIRNKINIYKTLDTSIYAWKIVGDVYDNIITMFVDINDIIKINEEIFYKILDL